MAKDGSIHVVVESPRGSGVKMKYEPSLGVMMLSRTLPVGIVFPFDFGFVPSTLAEDGDPLDVMIICDVPTFSGAVVACQPIGVVEASQGAPGKRARIRNDRVIAVAKEDRRSKGIGDEADLPARVREELTTFFSAAVALEGKALEILGWRGASAARRAIDRARVKR